MFRNGNRLREYIENSIHVRVVSPQPITPTCTLRPLAAAVIGRHNITGADIGIHLLFPFILGLKFFPLHKILSHYIFRESCCSFVLLENLLWINYPTVEDPPPKRTLPSFPWIGRRTFKCSLCIFSLNPLLFDRKPYHGDGVKNLKKILSDLLVGVDFCSGCTISCIIYSVFSFLFFYFFRLIWRFSFNRLVYCICISQLLVLPHMIR